MTAELRARFPDGADISLYTNIPGALMDAAVVLARLFREQALPFRIVDVGRKGNACRLPFDLTGIVDTLPYKSTNILALEPDALKGHSMFAPHLFRADIKCAILLSSPSNKTNEGVLNGLRSVDYVIVPNEGIASSISALDPNLPLLVLPIAPPRPLRIAILYRGPLRPSTESVRRRIPKLRDQLRALGHHCDTYLATWLDDKEPAAPIIGAADHSFLYEMPSDRLIERYVQNKYYQNLVRYPIKTAFYQYYMAKRAIISIEQSSYYDFIVHSRTDLDIDISPYWNEWLTKGVYNTWPTMKNSGTFVGDQFSVADPATMRIAWDYGTLERLGTLLDDVDIPEHVLQRNLEAGGLMTVCRPIASMSLDRGANS